MRCRVCCCCCFACVYPVNSCIVSWKGCSCSIELFLHLCQRSVGQIYVSLFLDSLIHVSIPLPKLESWWLWLHNKFLNRIDCFLPLYFSFAKFTFLAVMVPFPFYINCRKICQYMQEILIAIVLNLLINLRRLDIFTVWIFWSLTWHLFPIIIYLFCYLYYICYAHFVSFLSIFKWF